MTKIKLLSQYKKKRPNIPEFTCSEIDCIIEKIRNLLETKKPITYNAVKVLEKKLERLRESNDKLRDSGIYWYGVSKEILEEYWSKKK
tara:strand:- start:680 stop:943 length:264 start_codon:yes stop_codon:yes gene_type:complete